MPRDAFIFFWIYTTGEMRRNQNIFRRTYRSRLIGPRKERLTPRGCVRYRSCDRMIQDNGRMYKYTRARPDWRV